MNNNEKLEVEKILKHLFVGMRVHGLIFGATADTTHIMFTGHIPGEHTYKGDVYLHIESNWFPYETLPEQLPTSAEDMPERSEEERFQSVLALRRQKVTDVRLGETVPHLLLTLESGITIFVNGHHDTYECWQISTDEQPDLIVACPGDEIAYFA